MNDDRSKQPRDPNDPPPRDTPASDPPTDKPPTGEPPTGEPPTDEPPTGEPPADEPPTDDLPPIDAFAHIESTLLYAFDDSDTASDFIREMDSELVLPIDGVTPPVADDPLTPPRTVTAWAAIILALVAFTWFGKTLSNVITPLLLAVFLCYVVYPLVAVLERIGIKKRFGYGILGVGVLGVFYGFGAVIAATVAEFRSHFPRYEGNLDSLMDSLTNFARNVGLIRSSSTLKVMDLVEAFPGGGISGIITGGTAYFFEFVAYTTVTLFFLMFMLIEADRFNYRIRTSYGHSTAENILRVTTHLNGDIQRYVVLKFFISALTGLLTYAVMRGFNLDFAAVLALTIFAANFVPYVGSIAGTLLPAIVAVLQFSTFGRALIIVVLITSVHQTLGNVVEPKLQGRTLNISPLFILIALAYFGWMWGIVGMIVSVPIAAGIRLVLEQFEVTRSLARLMRDV